MPDGVFFNRLSLGFLTQEGYRKEGFAVKLGHISCSSIVPVVQREVLP